jgi:hypothetical protein
MIIHKFFIWCTMTHALRPFASTEIKVTLFFNTHTHLSDQKKCIQRTQPEKPSKQPRESMKKPLWAQKLHYRAQNCNSRRNENAFVAAAALKIAINYERRPKCSHADAD